MIENTKTFRLFISSTFNDLRAERDILQEKVFPKLREYCEKQGFNFLPIDLRWGVSEEAGFDQKTMKICIDEVKRAKESLSPHFAVLLGDRYGWIPLPYEVEADEFEKLKDVFYKTYDKNSKEIKYLNEWYKKDENSIPSKYILQPRTKQEHQRWEYWGDVEKTLREAFINIVENELRNEISEEVKIKYLKSATEQEIIEGIFKNNQKDKIFFFHREFSNLEDLSEKEIAKLEEKDKKYKEIDSTYQITIKSFSDFIDFTSNKLDKRIRKRHLDLIKRIKETLPQENVKDYSLKLDPSLKRTQDSITKKYLEEFAKDFEEKIKKAIDIEIEKVSKIVKDSQKLELIHQQNFLEEKTKLFIGRDEYLKKINDYIKSDNQTPLLITANSGSGKSSLMATAIKNTTYKLFFRFIGISELSTTPFRLYKSLLEEIQKLEEINKLIEEYKENIEDDKKEFIFEDLKELQKLMKFIFENYEGEKIVIFLDALDQFVTKDPLLFLPREMSEDIKIILSTLPKKFYPDIDYDERILEKYKEIYHIHLMPFSKNETEDYIDKFLLSYNRKITKKQKEKILSTFNSLDNEEKTPLYLKIILEEALNWHSYDDVSGIEFPKKVDDLIKRLFEELHTIHHHSKPLIDYAFSIIACSRDGMPEAEMFDILSLEKKVMENVSNEFYPKPLRLPTAVWARIYSEIKDYITLKEIDGMEQINFFHRKFDEGAYKLLGKEKTHKYLSKYYERVYKHYKEKEDNEFIEKGIKTTLESALVELPYQLIMSSQKKKTLELLSNFEFLMEKFKLNKIDEILEDYELAKERFEDILEDEKFFIYDRFISLNKHILKRGNNEWDASKIFFQLSIEHADNSPLTIAAEKYESEGKVDWDYFKVINRAENFTINSIAIVNKLDELKNITQSLVLNDNNIIFLDKNTLFNWEYNKDKLTSTKIQNEIKYLTKLNENEFLAYSAENIFLLNKNLNILNKKINFRKELKKIEVFNTDVVLIFDDETMIIYDKDKIFEQEFSNIKLLSEEEIESILEDLTIDEETVSFFGDFIENDEDFHENNNEKNIINSYTFDFSPKKVFKIQDKYIFVLENEILISSKNEILKHINIDYFIGCNSSKILITKDKKILEYDLDGNILNSYFIQDINKFKNPILLEDGRILTSYDIGLEQGVLVVEDLEKDINIIDTNIYIWDKGKIINKIDDSYLGNKLIVDQQYIISISSDQYIRFYNYDLEFVGFYKSYYFDYDICKNINNKLYLVGTDIIDINYLNKNINDIIFIGTSGKNPSDYFLFQNYVITTALNNLIYFSPKNSSPKSIKFDNIIKIHYISNDYLIIKMKKSDKYIIFDKNFKQIESFIEKSTEIVYVNQHNLIMKKYGPSISKYIVYDFQKRTKLCKFIGISSDYFFYLKKHNKYLLIQRQDNSLVYEIYNNDFEKIFNDIIPLEINYSNIIICSIFEKNKDELLVLGYFYEIDSFEKKHLLFRFQNFTLIDIEIFENKDLGKVIEIQQDYILFDNNETINWYNINNKSLYSLPVKQENMDKLKSILGDEVYARIKYPYHTLFENFNYYFIGKKNNFLIFKNDFNEVKFLKFFRKGQQ